MARKRTTVRSEYDSRPRISEPADVRRPTESTHKVRSAWFQAREAWPLRESPVELLVAERTRVALEIPRAPGADAWVAVGPSNIGGRMTSVVCHPTEPERLW